jgi:hypothetical protein
VTARSRNCADVSTDFLAKVRAGNAKVAGSGFGGKGLDKFESEREKVDRAQRSAYGEDGQVVEKPETKKEAAAAAEEADFKFKDFNVEIVKGPAPERMGLLMPQGPTQIKLGQDVSTLPPQTQAALNRAQAAGKNVQQSLADAVAKITASLNKTKADNRGGVAGPATKTESSAPDYHAIVPINDYPQKARWKATNKEQMVALQDLSGASITNKGESLRMASGFVLMRLLRYLLPTGRGTRNRTRAQAPPSHREQRRIPRQVGCRRAATNLAGSLCGGPAECGSRTDGRRAIQGIG